MNRNVRLIPAALVMVLLGACGPAEGNGNATPATGGNGKPSNSAIKVTATPEGEWKPGGSLCKAITAERVEEVVGEPITDATTSPEDMPTEGGLASCRYSRADGTAVRLMIMRVDDALWKENVAAIEKADQPDDDGDDVQRVTFSNGEGYVGHPNHILVPQATIRSGNVMAIGHDDGTNAANEPLATLTALAAQTGMAGLS